MLIERGPLRLGLFCAETVQINDFYFARLVCEVAPIPVTAYMFFDTGIRAESELRCLFIGDNEAGAMEFDARAADF
jgi:hypothetical protein